ncbi:MAG TPA: FecR domain-containing protein [Dyella sp.]|uniref:FecR family protein n=1 Tax=Dyella sp. TaxID=1869338 RepID=UPI002F949947
MAVELFKRSSSSDLRSQAQAWLLHLTSGQATSDDAEAFRAWLASSEEHERAFIEARLLWDGLGAAAASTRRQDSRAPRRRPQRVLPDSPKLSRRAFLGGALAASAAAVYFVALRPPVHLWPGLGDLMADYRTGTGEQRQVDVAPGVTVQMNTQTTIDMRKTASGHVAMELVSGEAQVLTDPQLLQPFTVFAGAGSVRVAAASQCNVRCTGPQVQVICLGGETSLACGSEHVAVQVAHEVNYGARGVTEPVAIDPQTVLAWRQRVLIFDNQPLADVIEEINRYRPGRIVLMDKQLAARKVHARFMLNQLAEVAVLIRDTYGAHVTSLPGGIVLLS